MLFNSWKHHAAALRERVQEYAAAGESGLGELATQVAVIGHELMDLYVGPLSPVEIAERVVSMLRDENRLDPNIYRDWLRENGGFAVLEFADDGTRWVLRQGEEGGRHVHVHPGRWAPETHRIRANVLKTAILVNAYVLVHGGDPLSVKVINRVRQQYLGLSPVGKMKGEKGLRAVIELLRPVN